MTPSPRLRALDRALRSRPVRLALTLMVVVSLVPTGPLEAMLRPLFLVVFGAELALRFTVWRGMGRAQSGADLLFTVADVLAFVSFLPLELVVPAEHVTVVALLRLSRLLVLLRFARGLALDVYAILTRREQLQQLGLVTGAVMFLSFVSAVVLSHLHIDNDGGHQGFLDQVWWAFRQMESADNLVPTVRNNPVLVLLSLLLTVTGVFIISFIIGIGTTIVDQLVRTERRRALDYHGHTVVCGPVHLSEVLIREFVRIYAKNRQIPSPEKLLTWLRYASPLQSTKAFPRVALLGRQDEPPPFLLEPLMRWVVYREGDAAEPTSLARVSAPYAKRAILLAREELAHEADAVTIASLAAFRAANPSAHAFVEVTESATVPIAREIGGPGTFALDVPRVLGMFLCQHLITPGVERLYRDLLTADGAEIYTHIFVDDGERAALRRHGGTVSFQALADLALSRGVVLIGVYLGEHEAGRGEHGVVNMDGLVQWLNPLSMPVDAAQLTALGARAGEVPWQTLRGLIGVTEAYLPLKVFAEEVSQLSDAPAAPAGEQALAAACHASPPRPRQVALIGASDALPSLLRELARYVPGVEVTLFMSERGDEVTPLPRRLENLGVGITAADPLPGTQGRSVVLERGGRLRVYTHTGPDLTGFAVSVLRTSPPIEAAVFLSEPEGAERDARTALRILRFTRQLEDGLMPHGDGLHVLAEFLSVDKGAHIQEHLNARKCGFRDESCMRLTLVSTDTIKNYFMVHSAFVPGVTAIYETLLEERDQEIIWLRFAPPEGHAPLTFRTLMHAVAQRGALAIGVDLGVDGVRLAPPPDEPLPSGRVVGVYAVADQPRLTPVET